MPTDEAITEKVIARIQDSNLSATQIEVLGTEILSLRTKETAAALFDMLIHQPGETVTTNLFALFGDLATRSPEWGRILEKSINKNGRCPRSLVSSIRSVLAKESDKLAKEVPTVRDLLADFGRMEEPIFEEQVRYSNAGKVQIHRKTQWFRSGKVRATVPITTELSDIRRMEELASILGNIKPRPDELCLDFSDVEHIYVVGLAALKAWCEKLDIVPDVDNVSNETYNYLDEIGFTRTADRHASVRPSSEQHFAVAIEPIVADSRPETIADKIVNVIDHHMHLSRKNRSSLIVIFAELAENIQRHAGASSPAFACAQVYPQRHKLTICIVDTGMGIKKSILSSSNRSLIQRVEEGESPVRLACSPLITSKPDKHSGYGLYVASELIVRNGGTFRIFSGNEIYTCYRKRWQRKEHLATVQEDWNGTWIAMIVDLDGLLLVEDVYGILPPIPGVELQDFFGDE